MAKLSMPRKQKFSDEQLREAQRIFSGEPDHVARIAKLLKVSTVAVRARLERLEQRVAPKAIAVVTQVESSVWDIRAGLENNFQRVQRLMSNVEENGLVRIGEEGAYTVDCVTQLTALYRESRAHHETALKACEALYRVEETKAFMEDVLGVLAEIDPDLRQRVMDRIKKRRSVRAAFVP